MPFYEYRCENCGHELEAMQKMSAAPLTLCPECGKPALVKLISVAGFRLKGGGWYETDFKSSNKKSAQDQAPKDSAPKDTVQKESKTASGPSAGAAGATD